MSDCITLTRQMFLGPNESQIAESLSRLSELSGRLDEIGGQPVTPERLKSFVQLFEERRTEWSFLAIRLTAGLIAVIEPDPSIHGNTAPGKDIPAPFCSTPEE